MTIDTSVAQESRKIICIVEWIPQYFARSFMHADLSVELHPAVIYEPRQTVHYSLFFIIVFLLEMQMRLDQSVRNPRAAPFSIEISISALCVAVEGPASSNSAVFIVASARDSNPIYSHSPQKTIRHYLMQLTLLLSSIENGTKLIPLPSSEVRIHKCDPDRLSFRSNAALTCRK